MITRAGQSYRCLEVTPYRRRNGAASALARFASDCADCHAEFVVVGSAIGFGTKYLNRRCAACKRPGHRVHQEVDHAQR